MTGFDISLLRPIWLVALLPLAFIGWALLRQRSRLGSWEQVANPELLRAMHALGRIDRGTGLRRDLLALVISGIAVLALTGPALDRRDTVSFRNLDAVVFVLDLSPSMTESSHWQEVQTLTRFAISALNTRPAALIVFGGDAYVASDLTHDHDQLGQTLTYLDHETVPDQGTRAEQGLAATHELLASANIITADVVLITDAAGFQPATSEQVKRLSQGDVRISVVTPDLDHPNLAALGEIGKGQMFAPTDIDELANWLRLDARTQLVRQDYPLLFVHDIGRYLLIFALAPTLLLFRRTAR